MCLFGARRNEAELANDQKNEFGGAARRLFRPERRGSLMSLLPKLYRPSASGAVLVQLLVSCTLTSDPYVPLEVNAPLRPGAADASTEVDRGTPPAGDASPVSTGSSPGASEVRGFELEQLPGGCAPDSGCESGSCREGRCQSPTCDGGRLDRDDAGSDCGGSACAPCAQGASCRNGGDCSSGLCGGDGACAEARCDGGVVNGAGPVVACVRPPCGRCGGKDPGCARCVAGDTCAGNGDCASGRCVSGSCSSCGDGERNATETGVDCGGTCGPCAAGDVCKVDADCQSAACQDGRCCGGTRVDCTRCARRLAQVLDCSSNGRSGAAQCDAFLDCLANNPDACPVRHAPGCSGDPGGVCNHTDFGTNTGRGVALADAILGTTGCTFGDE